MTRNYNQNELVKYLKRKGKFMSAREIATSLHATQQTTNRKLNKLTPRIIEKRVRKIKYGNQKRAVAFYRFKRKK